MLLEGFYVFLLFFNGAFSSDECKDAFKDLVETTVKYDDYCKNKVCVAKCCPTAKTMFYEGPNCVSHERIKNLTGLSDTFDFTDVSIYDKNLHRIHGKSVNDFKMIYNEKLTSNECAWFVPASEFQRMYILESGILVMNSDEYGNWEHDPKSFCIEYLVGKNNTIQIRYRIYQEKVEHRDFPNVAMLISCFFLALIILVYTLLDELRKLFDLILMSYIASLLMSFLIKGVQAMILNHANEWASRNFCICTSTFYYFFMLASFFWMNVMCFDIWWVFRHVINKREVHRRGIMNKFKWYCVYAFGTPFLVTAFAVSVIFIETPSYFVKPNFGECWSGDFKSTLYYIYFPLTMIISANWTFYLLTVVSVMKQKSDIDKHFKNSNVQRATQSRLSIFLKLSLVMGVSWALEVVGELVDVPLWFQIVTESYNIFGSVLLFILFVCKWEIIVLLSERFSIKSEFVEKKRSEILNKNKYSATSRYDASITRKRKTSIVTTASTEESLNSVY